jgi:hypothetical protein
MKARNWLVAASILAAILGVLPLQTAQADSASDPIRAWNELALKTARTAFPPTRPTGLNDARSARLYAMVNGAMYDAINGIISRHRDKGRGCAIVGEECTFIPPHDAPPNGDLAVAASAAAHAVLAGEFPEFAMTFPDGSPGYDAQREADLDAAGSNGHSSAGEEWGNDVGAWVRAARTGDSQTVTQPAISPTAGKYAPAWTGINLNPFAIMDPADYIGPGPEALSSVAYAGAYAEVQVVGDADKPSADMQATYDFWSVGGGTSQPPGAWLQIALAVTEQIPQPLPEMARLFALLSIVNADTVGATTLTKASYRHWRPTAAIQQATPPEDDGNPWTDADPDWVQRGAAATSPEHYSGHSAFGGAGAAALAGFFCRDDIPFAVLTDSGKKAGLDARHYDRFSAAGNEMGDSRVAGGLHFQFSNKQGLAQGRAIAAEVLATKLLLRKGPTHFGSCPR